MSWGGRKAQELTALTLKEWGTRCHLCGLPGADTADHIIPRSKGGIDSLENLRPAHQVCNSSRGNKNLSEMIDHENNEQFFKIDPACETRRTPSLPSPTHQQFSHKTARAGENQ